jgi:hypothetical protein
MCTANERAPNRLNSGAEGVMRPLIGLFVASVACTPDGETGSTDKDSDAADTAEGGGDVDSWRASGTGTAYFADGIQDNSLLTVEMQRASPPADGYAYHGFVSTEGGTLIPVGEITVNGEDVIFTADINSNAIVDGISHFEAWHSDGDGSTPAGDPVWSGDVNPTVFAVLRALLITNPATIDEEGSLRALETRVEYLRDECLAVDGAGLSDKEISALAERVANAIEAPAGDWDDDGTVARFDDSLSIEGDDSSGESGLVELIFADFGAAVDAIDPTDPIRENISEAYDGVQFLDFWAIRSAADAQAAAAIGGSSAEAKLADVAEQLDWTLLGYDVSGDGVLDENTEVGLDWAVARVSQMARMDIVTATAE